MPRAGEQVGDVAGAPAGVEDARRGEALGGDRGDRAVEQLVEQAAHALTRAMQCVASPR